MFQVSVYKEGVLRFGPVTAFNGEPFDTIEKANAYITYIQSKESQPWGDPATYTIEILDLTTDSNYLLTLKRELRRKARSKAEAAILDDYNVLEIAVIALFETAAPGNATTARGKIQPIVSALQNKLAEINAATTYEQLMAIVI